MPKEPAFEALLTIKEIAQQLKTCTRTVHRMIADADDPLPAIRIGRLVRVRQCDLSRYIAAHSPRLTSRTRVRMSHQMSFIFRTNLHHQENAASQSAGLKDAMYS